MGDLSSTSLDSSRRLLGHLHSMAQLPQNKALQRDQRVHFHDLISEVTDHPIHRILFVRSKSLSAVFTPVKNAWLWKGALLKTLFSSVQSLSRVRLFVTPWTTARQASLSFTISQSLLKFISIELVMPSNHLIPCQPLLLPPSIFPSISLFHWVNSSHSGGQRIGVSASASVLLNEYSGLISFSMDWLDLLAVQGTLKSLLQYHSSKASILLVLSILYNPTLTSIHNYWKNHSFN